MKTLDDTHIPERDCRFADNKLPVDAVLYGFTIDYNGDKKHAQLMDKLLSMNGKSPEKIVLDGVLRRQSQPCGGVSPEKYLEAPFSSFVMAFGKKIDLVISRLQRMFDLQAETECRHLDWLTYRDMVLVQVCAMCVDKQADGRDGYTIQSLLRRIGQEHLIAEIDKVLDKTIAVDATHNGISVRTALKTVRDKFLCHYDNHESYDLYGNDKENYWSVKDMIVLEQLLLPPVCEKTAPIGAVRELVLVIIKVFECATANAKWKMFENSFCGEHRGKARKISDGFTKS